MKTEVFHVYDSFGRVTLVLKPNEDSARRSFNLREREKNRDWPTLPIAEIVKVVQVS